MATIGLTGGAGSTGGININGSPVVEIGTSGINTGININGQTADATPDGEADYLLTYDASAAALKKILLNKATAFKIVEFSRNLTTASGTQAVTGVGFKPKAIVFIGAIHASAAAQSIGFSVDTTNMAVLWGASVYQANNVNAIVIIASSGNSQTATISSFDSDGFTLSWTKTGSPTGTATVFALCLR